MSGVSATLRAARAAAVNRPSDMPFSLSMGHELDAATRAAVQTALTTAEHDFLHAILRAEAELTWDEYASLVAELRSKREEVLREARHQLADVDQGNVPHEWLALFYRTERAQLA